MKKLNKKGFTLIELLAVIVILAVVLGIAIPAVSQYITKSKKNGYKDNLIQFIDAARKNATLATKETDYPLPVDGNTATVVPFSFLTDYLEKGGKKSSYDKEWDTSLSYVVIVNTGDADSPKYSYYVTAFDGSYGTGASGAKKVYEENTLSSENVIRLTDSNVSSDLAYDEIGSFNEDNGILIPISKDATTAGTIVVK